MLSSLKELVLKKPLANEPPKDKAISIGSMYLTS